MGSGSNADMAGLNERRCCCFRGECSRGRQGLLAALPYLTPEEGRRALSRSDQGIVNLSELEAKEARFVGEKRSNSGIRFGDLAPSRKGSLARRAAEVSSRRFGIRDVEEVRDLIVNRQKPLCLAG
jgi:hypothetical protein